MTEWPVLVDLPKHCAAVWQYRVFPYILEPIEFHIAIESELRSRQHTHHDGGIVLAGKPVRAHAEAFHCELVADRSGAGLRMLQTVVAHASCSIGIGKRSDLKVLWAGRGQDPKLSVEGAQRGCRSTLCQSVASSRGDVLECSRRA